MGASIGLVIYLLCDCRLLMRMILKQGVFLGMSKKTTP